MVKNIYIYKKERKKQVWMCGKMCIFLNVELQGKAVPQVYIENLD